MKEVESEPKIEEGKKEETKREEKKSLDFIKNRKSLIIIIIVILAIVSGIVIGVTLHNNRIEAEKIVEQERYDNLPIKVNITMTSYFGSINYILYELGLDFDLVTMGANCYSGVQKNEFSTEKYGILYTEFRYCKSNYTTIFRVYNDKKDQELRDPKPGELPEFDKYGRKVEDTTDNL